MLLTLLSPTEASAIVPCSPVSATGTSTVSTTLFAKAIFSTTSADSVATASAVGSIGVLFAECNPVASNGASIVSVTANAVINVSAITVSGISTASITTKSLASTFASTFGTSTANTTISVVISTIITPSDATSSVSSSISSIAALIGSVNGFASVFAVGSSLSITYLNTANGSSLVSVEFNKIISIITNPAVGLASSSINAFVLKTFNIVIITSQADVFSVLSAKANLNHITTNGYADVSASIFDLIKKTALIVYYEPKTNVFYEPKTKVFYE